VPSFEDAAKRPREYAAGTRLNYSNLGYTALGRVIEKVTGRTYEAVLRDASDADLPSGGLYSTAEDIMPVPYRGLRGVAHGGDISGFNSCVAIYPTEGGPRGHGRGDRAPTRRRAARREGKARRRHLTRLRWAPALIRSTSVERLTKAGIHRALEALAAALPVSSAPRRPLGGGPWTFVTSWPL
jgi:hypothetical protein